MKTIKFFRAVIVLVGLLLSACAPSVAPSDAPANVGGGKAVSEVIFTGVIESMNGDQWVINGETVQVDPSVIRDGSFQVGDTVKVEASVSADGSVIAQRVETPSAADLAEATQGASDINGNDDNTNDDNSNDVNDDNSNDADNGNDDSNETVGTVDALTDTSITVGGQTFTFADGVEIHGEIVPGDLVKLHFTVNADGSLSVREVETADPSQIDDDNGNDDNGNDDNANDDDSNDDNSNDDNGNDDSDDDNGNDDNDDDSNGGNDND